MSEVKVNKISPRSGTGVTLGDSGDKFTVPSGSNITINSGASIVNDGTATGFGSVDTEKVKVSSNDTTAGFLNGKLVAGTNITLTEGTDGGNETLTATLSGTIPTVRLGSGTASSSTFLRGDQTYASATPAANSITTAQLAYNPNPFRNIIINGDMNIAQRAASKTGITSDGYYTLDRFATEIGSFGTWTQSQTSDAPTGQGFTKCLKMDCTTAQGSPSGGNVMLVGQSIEGNLLQAIKQGTANAQSTTLSFWHKHTKTGTNIVELLDADNANAVSGAYTQSSSNTWEKATITFPANTSGTYDNDNARSLRIRFIIGSGPDYTSGTLATTWQTSIVNANRYVGQVNNADSTSNNFIITGVQYEIATVASEFEFLPFDVNLKRCQRYFQKSYNVDVNPATSTSVGEQTIGGGSDAGGNISVMLTQHGEMRSSPTIVGYAGGTSGSWGVNRNGASGTGTFNTHRNGQHSTSAYANIGAGWTVGWITGHFTMSSEL